MFIDKLQIVNSTVTIKLHHFTAVSLIQLVKLVASFTDYIGVGIFDLY